MRAVPGRRGAILAALLLFLAPIASARVALVGGTVIDGFRRVPLDDAVVLVDGDRIAAVGPRSETPIPPDTEIVETTGKYLVPGLIDAHVHLFQSGGLYTRPDVIDLRDRRSYEDETAMVRAKIPDTLRRYLASGVTSVLDAGGPRWILEARRRAREVETTPTVVAAGPLLATHAPPELEQDDPPILRMRSVEHARELVARNLAAQADLIKIWFVPVPGEPLAPHAERLRAAIDETHRRGARVAVHATQLALARLAVAAGADILAHGIEDARIDTALVREIVDRRVVYVTTLAVKEGYREALSGKLALSPFARRFGDPEAIATLEDIAWIPAKRRGPAPKGITPAMTWNLRRLQAAGAIVAAGSDAGNIGTLHGPGLHRELELLVAAGLSPLEALRAATLGGAAALGRNELRRVAPGQAADLLVLDADPLADITHLQRIHRVMKSGRLHDPSELVPGRD
ncbi:amidohydrolase [Sulfurifustis variabilis]|uniref:Amidohydrolase n=1 Tax=Sulfurifustis variabilis TaxID=1675686 RepID=A0A1B4VF37_9GAMM|nr:amidohydrolase family protein [Sulfurifustis variabilis]BAU49307.1 amidohydrolase [Sulfurifustis variabilis]